MLSKIPHSGFFFFFFECVLSPCSETISCLNSSFFIFGGTRVWTQGFTFTKQAYCLSHTSSPFCSGYFWRWGLINYCLGCLKLQSSRCELGLHVWVTDAWLFEFFLWKHWIEVFLCSLCLYDLSSPSLPPATVLGAGVRIAKLSVSHTEHLNFSPKKSREARGAAQW
jgi:hypothetical protein